MLTVHLPLEPRTPARRDLYALTSLAATREIALGVAAEARAKRAVNSTRLARHLAEYDLETEWILADPESRLARPWGETMRTLIERIPKDTSGIPEETRAAMALQLEEIRAGIPPSRDGRVMPSFAQMARDLDRFDEYQAGYQPMSWTSHPDLSAGGRFLRVVDGDTGQSTGAHLPVTTEALSSCCRAAHCFARCIERLAPEIGCSLSPAFHEAWATASQTCGHLQTVMGGRPG